MIRASRRGVRGTLYDGRSDKHCTQHPHGKVVPIIVEYYLVP